MANNSGWPIIRVTKGDISVMDTDVIVNAANSLLSPGGGVDGAIHRAAGGRLALECSKIQPCPTGEICVTNPYNLRSKKVFHAVGPQWGFENGREESLLRQCYKKALKEAVRLGFKSISFPAISTGTYGYPVEAAAAISIGTVYSFLDNEDYSGLSLVLFIINDEYVFSAFKNQLENVFTDRMVGDFLSGKLAAIDVDNERDLIDSATLNTFPTYSDGEMSKLAEATFLRLQQKRNQ